MRSKRACLLVSFVISACGGGGNDGLGRQVGTVVEERSLEIGGGLEQAITLGRAGRSVDLLFPADAVPTRQRVVVRLEDDVVKRGAMPVMGQVIQVATRMLTFAVPARMQMSAPAPPPGRVYSVVQAQEEAGDWTVKGPARLLPLAAPAGGGEIWEADIAGSGLWAIALVDLQDAGADASSPRETGAGIAVPLPQVSGTTPNAGPANTAVMLAVTGSNFNTSTVAFFNGVRITTSVQSDMTLTATVPAALTMQPGQFLFWVENSVNSEIARSNGVYFKVNAVAGAPEIVDYTPDNGVAGEKIRLVGKSLAGQALTITDPAGLSVAPGIEGTIAWWNGTMDTVEITIPQAWQTGPITVSGAKGTFRGKVFNVGRNLSIAAGAKATASSEYGGTWTIPRGADNQLSTSWFSANGDCATSTTCTRVPWFQVNLASPETIGRIAMRGNREYESGYDFIRGKFELLNPGGLAVWSASYDLPGPDRDLDIVLQVPIANVAAVKFTSEKDESIEPGFSELEVFGP